MKIKDGYIIKKVAGSNVIVPVSNPNFSAIISVNDTGAFLFEKLINGDVDGLTDALVAEYEIDEKTARADVAAFLNSLSKAGLLDE